MIVLGPDPHRIARLEEAGGGLAVADRLDGADLGKARIAHPAVGDRLARPAIAIAVGYGARAQDRPRAQPPRLGGMRDERAEIEGHVLARLRTADREAVDKYHDRASAVEGQRVDVRLKLGRGRIVR